MSKHDERLNRSHSPSHRGMRGPLGGGHPGPRPGMPVEKAKDFRGTLRRLLRYLKPHRLTIILIVVMALLSTIFTILAPKIMGLATTSLFAGIQNRIASGTGAIVDFAYIGNILLVLIVLYLFSSLFAYFQQYMMAGVAQERYMNYDKM